MPLLVVELSPFHFSHAARLRQEGEVAAEEHVVDADEVDGAAEDLATVEEAGRRRVEVGVRQRRVAAAQQRVEGETASPVRGDDRCLRRALDEAVEGVQRLALLAGVGVPDRLRRVEQQRQAVGGGRLRE